MAGSDVPQITRAPVRRVINRPIRIHQSSQPKPTLIRTRTKNRRATHSTARPVTMPEPIVDESPPIAVGILVRTDCDVECRTKDIDSGHRECSMEAPYTLHLLQDRFKSIGFRLQYASQILYDARKTRAMPCHAGSCICCAYHSIVQREHQRPACGVLFVITAPRLTCYPPSFINEIFFSLMPWLQLICCRRRECDTLSQIGNWSDPKWSRLEDRALVAILAISRCS